MNTESLKDINYVCPICKQSLTHKTHGLYCRRDEVEYPIKNEIPDFVTEDPTKSTSAVLRSVGKLDDLAKIYESPTWYGALDKINVESGLPSVNEEVKMLTEMVGAENGVGLDVACGTGIVTQSMAKKMRLV